MTSSAPLAEATALSPLAAIVLAGGASRRMGRDKATLEFAGRTFVEQAVADTGHPLFTRFRRGGPWPAATGT